MLGTSWLLVLGAFMIAGYLASWAAARAQSMGGAVPCPWAYVVAEAIIFVPLLVFTQTPTLPGAISSAAIVTLLGFAGLTAVAMPPAKTSLSCAAS